MSVIVLLSPVERPGGLGVASLDELVHVDGPQVGPPGEVGQDRLEQGFAALRVPVPGVQMFVFVFE